MTIYTQTARFDAGQRALTEDELFRIAPSIFACDAHHSRSERFAPIPTIEVVRSLNKEGFSVVGAKQALVRNGNVSHGKHMLRLRRIDDRQYEVGDSVFELLLKNANDGSAAYDLLAGLFRVLCKNSLVAEPTEAQTLRVRHTGDVQQKVIEGSYTVLERAEEIADKAQRWGGIQLTEQHRLAFAKGALVERFGEVENQPGTPDTDIQPTQVLAARRYEDHGRDLWKTFNVVQENLMRGWLTSTGRTANGQRRRSTTREVNGIDQSVAFNRGLWTMADWLARKVA